MPKIKDRVVLGVLAGLVGNAAKMLVDEVSLRLRISQRSFRSTAAGVWVSKRSETTNAKGQVLGGLFDFGMGSLGGIGMVHWLSKWGRDHLVIKGLLAGIGIGSVITALLSASPKNTVQPKDAASNLSYMLSHAVYGVVTTAIIGGLGHPSLFDASPINDYEPPTELTTEQARQYGNTQSMSESNSVGRAKRI